MLAPVPSTRLTVSPCTRIEKTTTIYVMVTTASRIGPTGSDRASATEMPPRRPPQVKILIVRALNSRTMLALTVFLAAYLLVIFEESLHLRKSKPVMVAAGVIWILTAIAYASQSRSHVVAEILRHNLLEYAELLLFLLSAMTFINTMSERNIFEALRACLVSLGLSLRAVFWLTGLLAFLLSPIADNLTTALVMGAVVMAMGGSNGRFIAAACINVVIAANAGGVFSPFGDITTLMVWQKGGVKFGEFFALFVPSLINWLIPAALMSMTISNDKPSPRKERVPVKYGGYVIVALFLITIAGTVLVHHVLAIPPFLGMMTGLGVLKLYGYLIRRKELDESTATAELDRDNAVTRKALLKPAVKPFDVFISMKRVEWDTLMFFYGIMLCVGGLGALGYLAALSDFLYGGYGSHSSKYPCRNALGGHRQYPCHVCRVKHEPGHESRPMAVGDVDRRCRRIAAVHRLGSRCSTHGAGTRRLYVLCPSEMDMGDCLGLCREYRCSSNDEWCPL